MSVIAEALDGDDQTKDWLVALDALVSFEGEGVAHDLLQALEKRARELGVYPQTLPYVPYRNSIPLSKQSRFQGI